MNKSPYFEANLSAKNFYDTNSTLTTIASRFIGENPASQYGFCAYSKKEFGCITKNKEFRGDLHDINFERIYPEAEVGQVAYAYAKVFSKDGGKQRRAMNPTCKTEVYVNGKMVKRSTGGEEINVNATPFEFVLEKGWNDILFRCEKTHLGFACLFATFAQNVSVPFSDFMDQSGFIYSELCPKDHRYAEGKMPTYTMDSSEDLLEWFPKNKWEKEDGTPFSRIFSDAKQNDWFVAKSNINVIIGEDAPVFSGEALSPVKIYIDGNQVYSTDKKDKYSFSIELSGGEHTVLVIAQKIDSKEWGTELKCTNAFESPCGIASYNWIYAGGFDEVKEEALADFDDMSRLLNTTSGKDYWYLDAPDMVVRPYQTESLFGKWTYPLGVTLFGIYKAGSYLGNKTMTDYVKTHTKYCADYYEYLLWDLKNYGHTLFLETLGTPVVLDYCGSMGSTSLASNSEVETVQKLAHAIKDVMSGKTESEIAVTPEGNFYRDEAHATIWADDMYMSLPFLSRYYKMTGDDAVMNEIADNIAGFKHYLYMEDKKYLGHVYSVTRKQLCNVPWSRGNGWCIFTLSEVLEHMPLDHPRRAEVMEFFNQLAEGYLELQDENGMWHQVLDAPESFEESSGTAMITYAFARAVRFGWVDGELKRRMTVSASRGWEALRSRCVDFKGNVYGVCCGSGFGFSTDYYARELYPVTNDTHGVGIVLLAGAEASLMLGGIAE